jgi:hypothetical protein
MASFNHKLLIILLSTTLVLPLISGFYKYYISQDYDYLVEAPCDSLLEICFMRDCSAPDECPPNNLSNYKIYYVKSYDFKKCGDNTCYRECADGAIECVEVRCGESDDDVCTTISNE